MTIMGKTKNSQKKSRSAQQAAYEQRETARLERKHRKYRRTWLITVLCVVLAAGVIGGSFAAYQVIRQKGLLLHRHIAAETEHYEVNAAMLDYYFQEHVSSYLSYASTNSDVPCFDPEQPLKEQYYDEEAETTWFDYIMSTTMSTVKQTLTLCEAAYQAGFSLTDEECTKISSDAAETDLSKYQNGVRTEDVETVMTLQTIASDYRKQTFGSIEVTDSEIAAEAEENAHDYLMFSMLCYTFAWSEDADPAEIAAAGEHAKALSECKTREAFEAYVTDYEMNVNGQDAEKAAQIVRAMRMTTGFSSYSDDVQAWIETAAPGDTYILERESSYFTEVMMLVDTPALDTSACADMRVIYLSASNYGGDIGKTTETAEKIMQKCKDEGSTSASFAQLVPQYSSDSRTVQNGGLVQGYSRIRTAYGAETADWLFEAGRTQGDMFLCKRDSAVVIVFYEGRSERCGWENQVYQKLYSDKTAALNEELNAVTVTVYEEVQQEVKE